MSRSLEDLPNAGNLAWLAALVAVEAPVKRGAYAHSASIPWVIVQEIRRELERAGFDWREVKKKAAAAEAARQALKRITAAHRAEGTP